MKRELRKTLSIVVWTLAYIVSPATAEPEPDVLLMVDLSVENEITIAATNGKPAATLTCSDTVGVYFDGYYGAAGSALAAVYQSGSLVSTLNTSDGIPDLFRGGAGGDPGLNIWAMASDDPLSFDTAFQAFTGFGTWTLSAQEYAEMPAGGSSGDLYCPADGVEDLPSATLIGRWAVLSDELIFSDGFELGNTSAWQ